MVPLMLVHTKATLLVDRVQNKRHASTEYLSTISNEHLRVFDLFNLYQRYILYYGFWFDNKLNCISIGSAIGLLMQCQGLQKNVFKYPSHFTPKLNSQRNNKKVF